MSRRKLEEYEIIRLKLKAFQHKCSKFSVKIDEIISSDRNSWNKFEMIRVFTLKLMDYIEIISHKLYQGDDYIKQASFNDKISVIEKFGKVKMKNIVYLNILRNKLVHVDESANLDVKGELSYALNETSIMMLSHNISKIEIKEM